MLRDLSPLELLRRRDEPVLRSPVLVRQDHRLEELHRLEPILAPDGVALLCDEICDALVMAQLREIVVRVDAERRAR